MKTKKLIKEAMCVGIARNDARKAVKIARSKGITNQEAFNVLYSVIFDNLRNRFLTGGQHD